jgi:DNA-binding NtrC family response regulator
MNAQPVILVVDDTSEFLRETSAALRPYFKVTTCSSPLRALRVAGKGLADLVITTLVMQELDGFEVIRRLRGAGSALPIIMVTSHGNENSAVEAMRLGAYDYLNRPVRAEELVARVRRALLDVKEKQLAAARSGAPLIVTRDPQMGRVLDLCKRAARADSRILILGETGTGKELIAKTIHALSPRREAALVEVNCAAIPINLLESELFGHERGAFTGATERRIGRFEEAADGTLFLDEIGELSHGLQSKLLRVLQSGEFSRVGSSKLLRSGARVIAATNRDLEKESLAGRFRLDLFYRLNVITLSVPVLRERPGDIPLLVEHFGRKFSARSETPLVFKPTAMRLLNEYHWPGNVRELEHLVERLAVLSNGEPIDVGDLPQHLQPTSTPRQQGVCSTGYRQALRDFELAYFRSLIQAANYNLAAAARLARLDRSQFFRKIKALGLHDPDRSGTTPALLK